MDAYNVSNISSNISLDLQLKVKVSLLCSVQQPVILGQKKALSIATGWSQTHLQVTACVKMHTC